MIKRILIGVIAICAVLAVIIFCYDNRKLESTDLSGISFDGIELGMFYDEIDVSRLTPTDRYAVDLGMQFEEVQFNVENNVITEMHIILWKRPPAINGVSSLKSISEVTEVLGRQFHEKSYDWEQGLMEHIYQDHINGIQANFVYSKYEGVLAWLILSELKS